jgi:hypothetical protein
VSEDELLRDDTLRFAERATRAGVMVSCRTWPHVPHVWQFLAGFLPEARESLDVAAAFVSRQVPASDVSTVMAQLAQLERTARERKSHPHETTVPRA